MGGVLSENLLFYGGCFKITSRTREKNDNRDMNHVVAVPFVLAVFDVH